MSPADLDRYDHNIREHLRAINKGRATPITLRYFQHLAALYTELYLDWRSRKPGELIRALNAAAGSIRFSTADLQKLAYWMATGSGKTLLMHLNLHQFLHYNKKELDNILLVTPYEVLSAQHIADMMESGITCRPFTLQADAQATVRGDAVKVIEITKLVEEKTGGGVSVPLEAFEGNNLIFVDEGHKGSGGEAWRHVRRELGQTGFTFEYSATFGQAFAAAKNNELTQEYGKAVVFDYSYRHFHGDGHGKDFRILNLKQGVTETNTDALIMGNLLSFYEQRRVFREHGHVLRPYNLDRPLWVFVGAAVAYRATGRKQSDILTITLFLHRVLENRAGWAVRAISDLLAGETGLVTPRGDDVFANRFQYLRDSSDSAESIYRDILTTVFHATNSGGLQMSSIRGSKGEIGLKASGGQDYFGLVYIGEPGQLKRLVETAGPDIVMDQDVMSDSLFAGIGDQNTTIEVLIGAKKFLEGWNSWRVSNMGLLNTGRSEGSEIIQLFGRGVRLRGKELSLKRSSVLDGIHPDHVDLLETLDIFAVRADYMTQFREYLDQGGVDSEGRTEVSLPIRTNADFLRKGLVTPALPEGRDFDRDGVVFLAPDLSIRVHVNLALRVQTLESTNGLAAATAQGGQEVEIPGESLELLDWQTIFLELLTYRNSESWFNMVIGREMPRRLLSEPSLYCLVAEEAVVRPANFGSIRLLHQAAVSILKKYMSRFYRMRREDWNSRHVVYRNLDQDDTNFHDYTVRVSRRRETLIDDIRRLIEEGEAIYRQEHHELPSIHFDRHLYQPLLVERSDTIKSDPPGLNPGEYRFVADLRSYCRREADASLSGTEVFLLRNLGRGRGVGFFDKRGFYPDFILWLKSDETQRIIFIEPHGMRNAPAYVEDDKVRLHERLPRLAADIRQRTGHRGVELDAFVVSVTDFETLRASYGDGNWTRERFTDSHILFQDTSPDYDYIALIVGRS